eukprot:TRINITY_DN11629_c0_g3_i4.p1 TRINITY_DN11629_c0_g3~~TRINITY_DN11629_c0_g3_i4.p1  ORF type:complete len:137 (-),score=30.35 TRINITY_DN11629_c0_g3_i4:2-412(-)
MAFLPPTDEVRRADERKPFEAVEDGLAGEEPEEEEQEQEQEQEEVHENKRRRREYTVVEKLWIIALCKTAGAEAVSRKYAFSRRDLASIMANEQAYIDLFNSRDAKARVRRRAPGGAHRFLTRKKKRGASSANYGK